MSSATGGSSVSRLPGTRKTGWLGVWSLLALVAAACGDAEVGLGSSDGEGLSGADAISQRPANGIEAAGGEYRAGPACGGAGDVSDEAPLEIAWVGPRIEELAAVGLETLVFDKPSLIATAYVDALNSQGGINGRCLTLLEYLWGLQDPQTDFQRICTELPSRAPLALVALGLDAATLECATIASGMPTLGIVTSMPDESFAAAEGLLFVDRASTAHLASSGLFGALQSGFVSAGDDLGLLYEEGATGAAALQAVREAVRRLGMEIAAEAAVPAEFGDLGILRAEREVRLLQPNLSAEAGRVAEEARSGLAPDLSGTLRQIESLYTATAGWFKVSEVDVVVSTTGWTDVRRLMRAAEGVGWWPRWVIDSSQPASLVLTDVPRAQGLNLVQVTNERAAGDIVPDLDRGCVNLRNTAAAAPPFAHRVHSDAWNLITSTCDSLDVLFAAMSRVDGSLTRSALVAELQNTDYETAFGSRIVFGPDDAFGADLLRVLKADPDCVLNEWGCMRSSSAWLPPYAPAAGAGSGGG